MRDARCGVAVALGLLAATLPACRREPAPASAPAIVIDARDKPSPSVSGPKAADAAPADPALPGPGATAGSAAAPAPAAPTPAAGSEAEDATVDISGEITLPPGPPTKDRLFVYITRGDCLNDSVPLLRRLPVSDNRTYFAAVLAPRGSSLSVCAAAEPGQGKPSHLYGRARAPVSLGKATDQSFTDINITLAEDSPRRFPSQAPR